MATGGARVRSRALRRGPILLLVPLYAEFSGDKEVARFEADDDGIIWDPPMLLSSWLVGHPGALNHLTLLRRRQTTVLLSDVRLARAGSYSRIVQIDSDGTPVPEPRPSAVLGVDLASLKYQARSIIERVAMWSDAGDDEGALEILGERGWPIPDQQWDAVRQAVQTRRSPKQRERILRVTAALKEKGPEEAQGLLDRLVDLNEDDRRMLQRRIRCWPHRLSTGPSRRGLARRSLRRRA